MDLFNILSYIPSLITNEYFLPLVIFINMCFIVIHYLSVFPLVIQSIMSSIFRLFLVVTSTGLLSDPYNMQLLEGLKSSLQLIRHVNLCSSNLMFAGKL